LKACLGYSRTQNEYVEDKSFDDLVGASISGEEHLYGLMLAVLAKNLAVLRYLFEDVGIALNDSDIFKLLKVCINAHWPAGFLLIINSHLTASLFS
jgi:hypothetical protein